MRRHLSAPLRRYEIYIFVIILLALGLRMFHLTYRGLWLDEVKTVARAELPIVELVYDNLRGGHLPFYFVAVKIWTWTFGNTEIVLRSLSIAFGLLGMIWFHRLARLLVSPPTALLALVLFSVTQINVWAAQEVRMYSLLIFLSVATSYYLILFLSGGWRGDITKFFIFSLCGLFTHVTYVFLLLAQAVALLAIRKRISLDRLKAFAVRMIASFILWLFALIPLMLLQEDVSLREGIKMPDIERLTEQVVVTSWGDYDYILGSSAYQVLIVLLIGFCYLAVRAVRKAPQVFAKSETLSDENIPFSPRETVPFLLIWFIAPFILLLLLSFFSEKFLAAARYCAIALPASSIIFAIGLSSVHRHKVRLLLSAIIAGFMLSITVGYQFSKGDRLREAIFFVSENHEQDDVVMTCSGRTNKDAFSYYTRGKIEALGVSREITDRKKLAEMISEAAQGKHRMWLFLYHEKDSPLAMVLEHDLSSAFEAAGKWHIGDVKVSLFEQSER